MHDKTEIKIVILRKDNDYCIYWDNPDYELTQVFSLSTDIPEDAKQYRIEHYSREIISNAIKSINGVTPKGNISVLGWSVILPKGETFSLVDKFKKEHGIL